MPEHVSTNLSFFEADIVFVEPNLKIWLDRIAIVEAVYDALRPWNIGVDDIEVIQTGKPSEQGVKFRVPETQASFFFSAGNCRFTRDSTSWETAEETIRILDTALKAFQVHSRTKVKTFKTAVALHVQPKTKKFVEIINPIVSPAMAALESSLPKSMATVLKWSDRRVTIDGSAQIANGVFIRYERDFHAGTDYETMAEQLMADEAQIFTMLDIVGD